MTRMDFAEWEAFQSNRKYVAISNDDLNIRLIRQFIKSHKEIVYSLPNIAQCLVLIGINQNDANSYKFLEDIEFPEGTVLSFGGNRKKTAEVSTLGDVFRSLEYDETRNMINKPSLKCNDCEFIQELTENFKHKQIELPFNVPTDFESKEVNSNQEQNSIFDFNDEQISNKTIQKQLDDKINEVQNLNSQLSSQSKEVQTIKGQLASTQKQLDDKNREVQNLNSQLSNQLKEVQTIKGQLASTQKQLDDKINEVQNLNSQLTKTRKGFFIVVAILISIIVALTSQYSIKIDDLTLKNTKIRNELSQYKNENSILKQRLSKTQKELDEALQKLGNQNNSSRNGEVKGNKSTIYGNNKNIRGNSSEIHGNNNDIYGNNNKIYGDSNRIHGNYNIVVEGKNNIIIEGNNNKI